jgi:hypothetical protein
LRGADDGEGRQQRKKPGQKTPSRGTVSADE